MELEDEDRHYVNPETLNILPGRISPVPLGEPKEELGTFEGFWESAKKASDISSVIGVAGRVASDVNDFLFAPNPKKDEVPEGWNSINEESVKDIPNKYWLRIWGEGSPLKQRMARREALKEMAHEEYVARSGWLSGTLGSFAGSVASFSSLIPIAGQMKYATVGKGVLNTLKSQMPGIAGQIAVKNALIQSDKYTGSLEDWATHSFFELAMTSGIVAGMGAKATAGTLANIKSLKAKYKGMDFKFIAGEKGEYKGIKVFKEEGASVGAAEVDAMQRFIDQGMVVWGEGPLFSKIFSASPGVRAMTSASATIRNVGSKVFESNIVTKGMAALKTKSQTAEKTLDVWRGMALNRERLILQGWAEHVGIIGPLKQTQAKIKNLMPLDDFKTLVSVAQRNNNKSDIPIVSRVAKENSDLFKKLYTEMVRLKEFPEGLNPLTAPSYLNKVGNKVAIQGDPEGFKSVITKEYRDQDFAIDILNRPTNNINKKMKELRELGKNIKGQDKVNVRNELRRLRQEKINAERELERKIADKDFRELDAYPELEGLSEFPEMLLDGRVILTPKQLDELESLTAPIRFAENELKEAQKTLSSLGLVKSFESFNNIELKGLAEKHLSEALKDVRNLGAKETIRRLTELRNDSLNTWKVEKSVIKEMKERLSNINKKSKEYKDLQSAIDIREASNLATELEKISRKTVLDNLRPFLSQRNVTAEELEKELKVVSKYSKGVTKEGAEAFKKRHSDMRKTVKQKEQILEHAKEQQYTRVMEGKVDQELYNIDKKGRIHFLDKNRNPKLRPKIEDYDSMAEAFKDSYLQQNDEQLFAQLFKAVESGGTNPMKSRTMMVRDLHMTKYLENDIIKLTNIHTNFLGKRIALSDALSEYGGNYHERLQGVVNALKAEKNARDFKIKEKVNRKLTPEEVESKVKGGMSKEAAEMQLIEEPYTHTPEKEKALFESGEQYKKDIQFLSNCFSVYNGNFHFGKSGQGLQEFSKAFKNYTASTMLSGLVFLQLPEIAMNLFRNELKEVAPVVRASIKSIASGRYKEFSQDSFGELGAAINSVVSAHLNEVYGHGGQYQPQYWWGRLSENAAKMSGNVFLSNYATDLLQSISGHIYQYKIFKALDKVVKKKELSIQDREMLTFLNLDEKWATRIMHQAREGGPVEFIEEWGVYKGNFEQWTDFKASQAMMVAIKKGIDATVIKPNMLDVPFAFRDPVVSMITQFMSYGFGAVNSILLPTLQQPDAKKIAAISVMMGLSAFVDAARDLYKGKEPDLSFKALSISAVGNSGAFGYFADWIQRANAVLDLPLIGEFKSSRYNREPLDILAGPLGGTMNSIAQVVNMFLSGKINEKQLLKLRDLTPLLTAPYLRYPVNKGVESLGLPKTKADARPWFGG